MWHFAHISPSKIVLKSGLFTFLFLETSHFSNCQWNKNEVTIRHSCLNRAYSKITFLDDFYAHEDPNRATMALNGQSHLMPLFPWPDRLHWKQWHVLSLYGHGSPILRSGRGSGAGLSLVPFQITHKRHFSMSFISHCVCFVICVAVKSPCPNTCPALQHHCQADTPLFIYLDQGWPNKRKRLGILRQWHVMSL